MDYCGPKGLGLHEFLSWPQESQDAALAWQAYNNRRCGQCGVHLDDWKEDLGGDREAWHAEQYTCPGCLKLGRLQETLQDAKGGIGPGVHTRLALGAPHDCPRCTPDGR